MTSPPLFPLHPTTFHYCPQCLEQLYGQTGNCDACRAAYDLADERTYLTYRPFRAVKFWLPAWLFAVVSGSVAYGLCLAGGNDMGYALFVAVPISIGAIFGYGASVRRAFKLALALVAIAAVVMALVTFNLAGFF